MNLDTRIDLAVERLRHRGRLFQPIFKAPWIAAIETRIGHQLPAPYRSLVQRYSFPLVELGSVELFSNRGDGSYDDVTSAPFRDPILSPWLIRSGCFHFARTASGNYDPVCFDLSEATAPKTPVPIVQFDHEAILLEHSAVPRETVAASFLWLLEEDAEIG